MHGNDAGEVNMRLIVHMGLHKTGSTYLQHIFNDNHEALLGRGVYYQKQPGYPAHHFGAWDILRGDTSATAAMVGQARIAGCHTHILSTEDRERASIDGTSASQISWSARAAGLGGTESHKVPTRPRGYLRHHN